MIIKKEKKKKKKKKQKKKKKKKKKQREKMTDGLVKWLGAGKVVEILKATRDRGI